MCPHLARAVEKKKRGVNATQLLGEPRKVFAQKLNAIHKRPIGTQLHALHHLFQVHKVADIDVKAMFALFREGRLNKRLQTDENEKKKKKKPQGGVARWRDPG